MDGRLCLLVRICRQTLLNRQGAVLLSVCLRQINIFQIFISTTGICLSVI